MALEESDTMARTDAPIIGELSRLHSQIERLEHQAKRLRERVASVLGGPIPQAVAPEADQEFFGSEISKSIHSAGQAVSRVADGIVEIVDRLET